MKRVEKQIFCVYMKVLAFFRGLRVYVRRWRPWRPSLRLSQEPSFAAFSSKPVFSSQHSALHKTDRLLNVIVHLKKCFGKKYSPVIIVFALRNILKLRCKLLVGRNKSCDCWSKVCESFLEKCLSRGALAFSRILCQIFFFCNVNFERLWHFEFQLVKKLAKCMCFKFGNFSNVLVKPQHY